jgi:hypothetical protein
MWGTDDILYHSDGMKVERGEKGETERHTDKQTVLLHGSDWLYQCRGINFQRSKHVNNNNKKYFTSLFLSLLGGEKRQVIPPAVDTPPRVRDAALRLPDPLSQLSS